MFACFRQSGMAFVVDVHQDLVERSRRSLGRHQGAVTSAWREHANKPGNLERKCENPTTQSPATRANYLRSAVLAKATDTMQDGNLTKRERDSFPTTTNKVRWGFCFTCWNSSSALLGLEGKTNMHKSMQTNWNSSTQKHIQPHHLQSPKTCRSCKSMMSSF